MDRQQIRQQAEQPQRYGEIAAEGEQKTRLPLLLYAVHPLLLGPAPSWPTELHRIASLGFNGVLTAPVFAAGMDGNIFHIADHDRPHPVFTAGAPFPTTASSLLSYLVEVARAQGLDLYLDIVLNRVAASGVLASSSPVWRQHGDTPDRRAASSRSADADFAPPRLSDPATHSAYAGWWIERLAAWRALGVRGFRCIGLEEIPPQLWRAIMEAHPDSIFIAWTPGLPASFLTDLSGQPFTATCDSLAWWDFQASWMCDEHDRLIQVASPLAVPEALFGPRLAARFTDAAVAERFVRRQLYAAATIGAGCGWIASMGIEYGARWPLDPVGDEPDSWLRMKEEPAFDLTRDLQNVNAIIRRYPGSIKGRSELQTLGGAGGSTATILHTFASQADGAANAVMLVSNADMHNAKTFSASTIVAAGGTFAPYQSVLPADESHIDPCSPITLAAGEARVFSGTNRKYKQRDAEDADLNQRVIGDSSAPHPDYSNATFAARPSARIAIEAINPCVEAGRFPVKRTIGDVVTVEADLVCDGHENLSVNLLWRPIDNEEWRRTKMTHAGNDRWNACFPLETVQRHVFCIEAWVDTFLTFRDELQKKHQSGADISLEIEEGLQLLRATADWTDAPLHQIINQIQAEEGEACIAGFMSTNLSKEMEIADKKPFLTHSRNYFVDCEPLHARFAAWYELFPRSQAGKDKHHGTFNDVIRQIPRIRAMGFDVLYLTPIHPIGQKNRKGRNNSLDSSTDDPGSPYAIGAEEGGHDAIHPELGTLEDFHRLRTAARESGMMIALDFAIQCSPDHPWIQKHREWFSWRPDGSIRHAENPPKKYEDIVNVNFYATEAIPSLWLALRDVVRFWISQGITLFRVDNPHTKPFPFWEWLIADIRRDTPECVFLSEAFTRPKRMYRLAKLGFGQSYTYFTWRNTKSEIQNYITELDTDEVGNFFRPHFFVNTPDINPTFLHSSGRPGFLIRAALAATLSGLWGIYSGFELCESQAVPGKEEYQDSEKYEIRKRNWQQELNITREISRLNRIRKANPALQSHRGTSFHNAFNDQVIWYRRATADRSNTLLIAVCLDPFHAQEAMVELPLWEWGLPDHAALQAEDLMRDIQLTWQGKNQFLKLDPTDLPFGIWRVHPASGG